jgi:hypothetical protein
MASRHRCAQEKLDDPLSGISERRFTPAGRLIQSPTAGRRPAGIARAARPPRFGTPSGGPVVRCQAPTN